jgi:hypothetical protein
MSEYAMDSKMVLMRCGNSEIYIDFWRVKVGTEECPHYINKLTDNCFRIDINVSKTAIDVYINGFPHNHKDGNYTSFLAQFNGEITVLENNYQNGILWSVQNYEIGKTLISATEAKRIYDYGLF